MLYSSRRVIAGELDMKHSGLTLSGPTLKYEQCKLSHAAACSL